MTLPKRPATRPQRVRATYIEVRLLLVEDPDRTEEVAVLVELAVDVVIRALEVCRTEEIVGPQQALSVAAAAVIDEVHGELGCGGVA